MPSSGIWLTVSSLPFCAIILAVTVLTNSGASAATAAGIFATLAETVAGYLTSSIAAEAASMHLWFIATTSSPFFEYALVA